MEFNDIYKINNALSDMQSKYIFMNRLLFSMTGDFTYIENLQSKFYSEDNRYILWGRGYWSREILKCYPSVKWKAVCDNNVKDENEIFNNLPVNSFMMLQKEPGNPFYVIATRKYHKEIEEQLLAGGISQAKIINLGKRQEELAAQLYFDLPYLHHADKEVFVDGGCYDGTTTASFVDWCQGKYEKVFAFEPDSQNAHMCKIFFEKRQFSNIELEQCALSDNFKLIQFDSDGSFFSRRKEDGSAMVQCIPLKDDKYKEATFIKLDIEGMELEALNGMREIILNNKPQLAISVYHKAEDILQIPLLILQLNPSYQLYLRHYSIGEVDTILYAVNGE